MDEKLKRAVRRALGGTKKECDEVLRDVAKHGADAGWSGFTYYTDTIKFYDRHKVVIWDMLYEQAEEQGERNVFALVAHFRRAQDVTGYDTMANLLAWYALEEVARDFVNSEEA